MKNFLQLEFEPRICRSQLAELQQLLQSKESLSERDDILPFFRERPHLSAFVASYHPQINRFDRVAFEYDLFGDFTADLVVGDSIKKSYCFVEFEDARHNSIFLKSGRNTPEWAPRFEKGFSQIIDWFWKLDDLEKTDDFENRFNGRSIDYMGLLIIGRNEYLEPREKKRLAWRQRNLIVNSKHIYCLTFDELYDDLSFRLNKYQFAPHVDD
jgi:hypothetical protein